MEGAGRRPDLQMVYMAFPRLTLKDNTGMVREMIDCFKFKGIR
jgi:hypothetical protein